jgi:hypothetical protein
MLKQAWSAKDMMIGHIASWEDRKNEPWTTRRTFD